MVISVLARNGGEGASIDKPYSIPLEYATACWTYVRMQHTLDQGTCTAVVIFLRDIGDGLCTKPEARQRSMQRR